MKVNIQRVNSTIQTNCPMQNYSESFERKSTLLTLQTKKFTTFSYANKEQTCRRSRKQLFWMNCPIINLWNKQAVLRENIFQWRASKNSSWVKSKKTRKTKCDISLNRLNVFFEFPEFLGEVG